MDNRIVECIPNFSEGRRKEVIDQIVVAAKNEGVQILDVSSDSDHNRTVLTFAGEPKLVEQAAFAAIKKASEMIDLDVHQGEHPRIGATDVVPFVPIRGITLAECVEMAKHVGQRVSKELQIPVYFYEAAATRSDRTNLENIRKGQYEGLKADILTNLERKPDLGPAALGKAGATVIGARTALIAFNVYLTTADVAIAKNIAKAVRHSSGGFKFVKAAGFLVEGQAQVSMNLTDYKQTPIARVVEAIRREAARYGVGIHHSELVGLIPQEALVDTAVWYTQLDQFNKEQVLETRLAAAGPSESSAPPASGFDFLNRLASNAPTPGGGSAAAFSAAMAAGLVGMVAGGTIGKKKYAEVEGEMVAALAEAESLRKDLTIAVEEDAKAFEVVMASFKLPKETAEQITARGEAIQKATLDAAILPLGVAKKALRVMELGIRMMMQGNVNAISDAASAVIMANAAVAAAGLNVKINIASLEDKQQAVSMLPELAATEQQARLLVDAISAIMKDRAGL